MNNEQGVRRAYLTKCHVVILGAGASIASANRNPEPTGKRLPSMDNLVEIVGLRNIIQQLPPTMKGDNFEEVYSNLYEAEPDSHVIREINRRVSEYFGALQLPPEPTLYDYLVLSLPPNDLIATFNWDPFLYDACWRNHTKIKLPRVVYLHGNVRVGYCLQDMRKGHVHTICSQCGQPFIQSRLLFPVKQKNYSDDPYIKNEWNALRYTLKNAAVVTIFGYGAPKTDVEAVQLMREAWGTPEQKNLEQFEIIDIQPEDVVRNRWSDFIHSHHYDYCKDYFESRLALFPRRSVESFVNQFLPATIEEAFQEPNYVPRHFSSHDEMWGWFRLLVQAEGETL